MEIYTWYYGKALAEFLEAIHSFVTSSTFVGVFKLVLVLGIIMLLFRMIGRGGGDAIGLGKFWVIATMVYALVAQIQVPVKVVDRCTGHAYQRTAPWIIAYPLSFFTSLEKAIRNELVNYFNVPNSYKQHEGCFTGYELLKPAITYIPKDPYLRASIRQYIRDCFIPTYLAGDIDRQALVSSRDVWNNVMACTTGKLCVALFTVYYSPSNPEGKTETCPNAYARISLDIANEMSEAYKNIRDKVFGTGTTISESLIPQYLAETSQFLMAVSYTADGLIRQAITLQSLFEVSAEYATAVAYQEAYLSALSRLNLLDFGRGGTLNAMKGVLLVVFAGLTPFFALMFLTPIGSRIFYGWITILAWLATWSVAEVIVVSVLYNFLGENQKFDFTIADLDRLNLAFNKAAQISSAMGDWIPVITFILVSGSIYGLTSFAQGLQRELRDEHGAKVMSSGNFEAGNVSTYNYNQMVKALANSTVGQMMESNVSLRNISYDNISGNNVNQNQFKGIVDIEGAPFSADGVKSGDTFIGNLSNESLEIHGAKANLESGKLSDFRHATVYTGEGFKMLSKVLGNPDELKRIGINPEEVSYAEMKKTDKGYFMRATLKDGRVVEVNFGKSLYDGRYSGVFKVGDKTIMVVQNDKVVSVGNEIAVKLANERIKLLQHEINESKQIAKEISNAKRFSDLSTHSKASMVQTALSYDFVKNIQDTDTKEALSTVLSRAVENYMEDIKTEADFGNKFKEVSDTTKQVVSELGAKVELFAGGKSPIIPFLSGKAGIYGNIKHAYITKDGIYIETDKGKMFKVADSRAFSKAFEKAFQDVERKVHQEGYLKSDKAGASYITKDDFQRLFSYAKEKAIQDKESYIKSLQDKVNWIEGHKEQYGVEAGPFYLNKLKEAKGMNVRQLWDFVINYLSGGAILQGEINEKEKELKDIEERIKQLSEEREEYYQKAQSLGKLHKDMKTAESKENLFDKVKQMNKYVREKERLKEMILNTIELSRVIDTDEFDQPVEYEASRVSEILKKYGKGKELSDEEKAFLKKFLNSGFGLAVDENTRRILEKAIKGEVVSDREIISAMEEVEKLPRLYRSKLMELESRKKEILSKVLEEELKKGSFYGNLALKIASDIATDGKLSKDTKELITENFNLLTQKGVDWVVLNNLLTDKFDEKDVDKVIGKLRELASEDLRERVINRLKNNEEYRNLVKEEKAFKEEYFKLVSEDEEYFSLLEKAKLALIRYSRGTYGEEDRKALEALKKSKLYTLFGDNVKEIIEGVLSGKIDKERSEILDVARSLEKLTPEFDDLSAVEEALKDIDKEYQEVVFNKLAPIEKEIIDFANSEEVQKLAQRILRSGIRFPSKVQKVWEKVAKGERVNPYEFANAWYYTKKRLFEMSEINNQYALEYDKEIEKLVNEANRIVGEIRKLEEKQKRMNPINLIQILSDYSMEYVKTEGIKDEEHFRKTEKEVTKKMMNFDIERKEFESEWNKGREGIDTMREGLRGYTEERAGRMSGEVVERQKRIEGEREELSGKADKYKGVYMKFKELIERRMELASKRKAIKSRIEVLKERINNLGKELGTKSEIVKEVYGIDDLAEEAIEGIEKFIFKVLGKDTAGIEFDLEDLVYMDDEKYNELRKMLVNEYKPEEIREKLGGIAGSVAEIYYRARKGERERFFEYVDKLRDIVKEINQLKEEISKLEEEERKLNEEAKLIEQKLGGKYTAQHLTEAYRLKKGDVKAEHGAPYWIRQLPFSEQPHLEVKEPKSKKGSNDKVQWDLAD